MHFKQGVDKRQKNANFYYNATRDELALLTKQHELEQKHPSVRGCCGCSLAPPHLCAAEDPVSICLRDHVHAHPPRAGV